jgi:7-cyano-7-deazaguanine synthase
METVVSTLSGGLDSTTLAYKLKSEGFNLSLLSFDYGQRHKKELAHAIHIAKLLESPHHIVDLTSITSLIKGSSLTDNIAVPEGHYAEDNMIKTVVPNRNAIMLAIAFAHASSINAEFVAAGIHAGDHAVYADCRPEFISAFSFMEAQSLQNLHQPTLVSPFVHISKTEIARLAGELKVPVELTWSCYKGEQFHCGRCGTCVERLEALHDAGVDDPTVYADYNYWKTVTKEQ